MIKYAIIENEHFSLEALQRMVSIIRPNYKLIFTAESISETIEFFKTNPEIDLILMDVELVDGNCFEIFKQIHIDTPIIFTTAYNQYAIRAFKVNSIDYLLKPILQEDVEAAFSKYEIIKRKSVSGIDYAKLADTLYKSTPHNRILLNSGNNFSYATINEIAFILSEDHCIYTYLSSGVRKLTTFQKLSDIEQYLPKNQFFQLSRAIISNISSINSVSKFLNGRLMVKIIAGNYIKEVIVSASKRQEFLNWLGTNQ